MTRRRLLWLAPILLIALALVWYGLSIGTVPPGQPPLATLDNSSLATLRADFNREADKVRIIVLLSPT